MTDLKTARLRDAAEVPPADVSSVEPLLTAVEVGQRLGLSSHTVLNRFQGGKLPGFRIGGTKGSPVRFRWSEIEAALETWRT